MSEVTVSDGSAAGAAVVNLTEATAQRRRLAFDLDAAALPRLAALAEQAQEDAVGGEAVAPGLSAELDFEPHEAPRFAAVSVRVTGQCALPCQRCLELVRVGVGIDAVLALGDALDDEAIDALDGDFERWDHEGETLDVTELVEELVLLDLPLVVMHERREDCGPLAGRLPEETGSTSTQRPFAGLEGLLAGKDN